MHVQHNYINMQYHLFASGMEKINFSGGEPFIKSKGHYVGKLVCYCKQELGLPSVTIVSNGSLITEDWFQEYGKLYSLYTVLHTSCKLHIEWIKETL